MVERYLSRVCAAQNDVSGFELEVVKVLPGCTIEAVKIPLSGSVTGFAGDIGAVLTRQDISTILQCGPSRVGQDRAPEGRSMSTVKSALAQKKGALIDVRSGDTVVEALRQMRDNRVRSVLVIDDDVLVGIVTQGDCAIKVLLPGLDAKTTPVSQVMTSNPVTVKPDDRLEGCMAMMAARGFRHLPVLDAGKVVGVISIGDVVKNIIRDLEHNVDDLMGYIMKDGPGG
ncbi:CBS domain-containing protein [Bradyrhizobium sp. Ghvi]|uniref:CBS domain-containing protein n=1 Tax=Bradyrhizobium sp. Ghvi TaxID=1855319 RepID=UPI0008E05A01|nr:CBS domain-containing protein [Bradyrhizobium sp. Ghvi]SFO94870.1 CBS domain-containing protein [Bradyrhizobium sp. Ghvi]